MKEICDGIRAAPPPQIEAARKLMRSLFDGITDKGGKPYAEHCERVEAALPAWVSDDARCAALLHDVVEDCGVTGGDLRRMGFSDRAVWLVLMLSRMTKEVTYMDWIKSIAATGDPELIAIKLSDNLDNSDPDRIAALPPEQRDIVRRYEGARRILEPALEGSRMRRARGCQLKSGPHPMTHDEKIVEAVARAICAEMGDDWEREGPGNVLLEAYGPLARAAITAYQAEVEKERRHAWWNEKANREGFETKIDWIRHYRARTGCLLKQALAAYDAGEPMPLPNPPASP